MVMFSMRGCQPCANVRPWFIEFARNQIDWYRNTYPHITIDVPDWFETKCRLSCLSMKRGENEITDFIFVGKAIFK